MNQRNTQHRNIIFLKEQKGPIDKYESPTSLSKFVPLIKHKHIPDETLQLLRDPTYLRTLRYIIITSQRTAECLSEDVIPGLTSEQLRELLTKCVYTVGPATGNALRKLGFKDIRGEDTGNGAALSKFIIEDLNNDNDNNDSDNIGEILFLVGVIRKDIVTRTLTEAGLKVREVVTYETSDLDDNLPRFQSALYGIRQFVNESGNENNNDNDDNNNNNNNGCWVVVFSPQGVSPELIDYIKVEQQQQQQHQQESNSSNCSVSSIGESSFEMEENVDGQSIRSSISSQSSTHSIPLKVACIGPTTEMFLTRCGLKPEVVSPKPNPTALHNALEEYDSNS